MPNGIWCGTGANFDAIKALLSQMLQSWNAGNPSRTADLVLGAVDSRISNGSAQGCAEGMAGVNAQVAWIRAIPDGSTPSMSGGLASMELAHTLGVVPLARDDAFNPYHSPNIQADGLAPDRAYNVTLRSVLVNDRTVMTISTGWDQTTVVYEQPDYGTLLCRLGGQATQDCTAAQSATVGSATGVAAGPQFVMSGTTDLATQVGTDVAESYFTTDVAPTRPDPNSQLKLVQVRPTGGPSVLGVPLSALVSDHDHGGGTDHTDTSPRQVFSIAFPFDTTTTRIELRLGGASGTLLYARDRSSVAPVVNSVSQSASGFGIRDFSDDSSYDDFKPAISSDGAWIAWETECDKTEDCGSAPSGTLRVVIAPANDVSLARAVWVISGTDSSDYDAPALIGSDPTMKLALTIGDALYTAPVTILEGGEAEVRDTDLRLRYDGSGGGAHDPSWNADGTRVAYTVDGDVWALDDTATPSPVQLTFSGDASDPAWSHTAGDDRIAYTRSDAQIVSFSSSVAAPAEPATILTSARPPRSDVVALDAPQTFTVDSLAGAPSGACTAGACTLADAINAANTNAGADTIDFDFSAFGTGPYLISLTTALPTITDAVLIDGASAGTPNIQVDNGTTSGAIGFFSSGIGPVTIQGLSITGFAAGIRLDSTGGNIIAGNWIGLYPSGAASGNADGVVVVAAPAQIGGGPSASRNIISGNTQAGINVSGSTVVIKNNRIGTDPTGLSAVPNIDGILIQVSGAATIGGTAISDPNVISGNSGYGIEARTTGSVIDSNLIGLGSDGSTPVPNLGGIRVDGATGTQILRNTISGNAVAGNPAPAEANGIYVVNSTTTTIQSNSIGLAANGDTARPNKQNGIYVSGTSSSTLIGGSTAGQGNVISANGTPGPGGSGVSIEASGTTVLNNRIGTNATGTADRGNAIYGVSVVGGLTSPTVIGGTGAAEGNLISGNGVSGIQLTLSSGTSIRGNKIGTDAVGTGSIPNDSGGVVITNGPNNTVGGTAAGAGNIIRNNQAGVLLIGSSATGNAIRGNSIDANTDLGIGLSGAAVTPNDSGDADAGPNGLQNYPDLTSATTAGSTTKISGVIDSSPGGTYDIDFYASPTCDGSTHGEGATYLGSSSELNLVPFTFDTPTALADGTAVTATATDPSGNTSEFSACVLSAAALPSFVVTDPDPTHSDGVCDAACTFSDAIEASNAHPGADTITFNMPGGPSPVVIFEQPTLLITDAVTIDATTQNGYVAASGPSSPGQPVVGVDGNGETQIGLDISTAAADGTTVKGLSIYGYDGADIRITGASHVKLQGNWVGVDPSGTAGGFSGVAIDIEESAQTSFSEVIGGSTDAQRNVIGPGGIWIVGDSLTADDTAGHVIRGNYIGLDPTGANGIDPSQSTDGMTLQDPGEGIQIVDNVISGNRVGVDTENMDAATISGNRVGTDQSGALDVGNLVEGFKFDVDSDQNTFTSNVISGNGFAAVSLASDSSGNVFEKNSHRDRRGGDDRNRQRRLWRAGDRPGAATPSSAPRAMAMSISGNTGNGIDLSSSSDTNIEGNMIGLGADGTTALGNGGSGVVVAGGSGTIIGGTSFGSNNYISSNGAEGIRLESTSATSILGNTIGASASGSLDRGNATSGIWVKSTVTGTVIGSPVAGNFIVGNDGDGILLSATTSGTTIKHNTIGQFSMPNGESGIEISDSPGNTIGGVSANEGNAIVGNSRDGVTVGGAAATDNSIRGSGMIGNGSLAADLGIDLGSDGVNLNDPGDGDVGANDLQNFPVLSSAVPSGGVSQVSGTLDTGAGTFTIDLYRVVTCDPSGDGEGQLWIGSGSTTAGAFTFDATETVPPGLYITATATSPTGDTSEFSPCFLVTAAATGSDLALSNSAGGVITVTPGDDLVIPLTVHNIGPAVSPGAGLAATLPPDVHFAAESGPFTCSEGPAGALSCTTGPIAVGADAIDSIVLRATADATRDSHAAITFTVTGRPPTH